ncbi:MAG: VUT family protein [Peptococcaceae bacterium]|nr:VUT family protein [Peptococcaceae bacterium]
MILVFYLFSIVIANVGTAAFMPLQLGIFLIPYGTWFIGATFVLRDMLQKKYGRKRAYLAIFIALVLSAITSKLLGDTLAITFASAVSFLISESADTEIYTRFKVTFLKRVFTSGLVSSFLDSVIFIVLGLSPLISGFLPWEAVPGAVGGQFIVKTLMQVLGVFILYIFKNFWEVRAHEGKTN